MLHHRLGVASRHVWHLCKTRRRSTREWTKGDAGVEAGWRALKRTIAGVFRASDSDLCCCVSLGHVRWLLPPPRWLHALHLSVIRGALDVRRAWPHLWPLTHHPLTLETKLFILEYHNCNNVQCNIREPVLIMSKLCTRVIPLRGTNNSLVILNFNSNWCAHIKTFIPDTYWPLYRPRLVNIVPHSCTFCVSLDSYVGLSFCLPIPPQLWDEMWYRYSWCPGNVSWWLCGSPDFSAHTTSKLTFEKCNWSNDKCPWRSHQPQPYFVFGVNRQMLGCLHIKLRCWTW